MNALERIAAALETIAANASSIDKRVTDVEREVAAQGDMLHLLSLTIGKVETDVRMLAVGRARGRPRKGPQP